MSVSLRAVSSVELPEFDSEVEKYLHDLLNSQDISNDGEELASLRRGKEIVERTIREAFPDSVATIRIGGSIAKDTANKETYDLDLPCYFPNGGNNPGNTLKEIYDAVANVLGARFRIKRKTSAIRILSNEKDSLDLDLHIDVVPGRFVDLSEQDCFLCVNDSDRERLQTNLDTHISHIKGSGLTQVIRLVKIWKHRWVIDIKTFPLELLVIKVLDPYRASVAGFQLNLYVFLKDLAETAAFIGLEDPANPAGNNLHEIWNEKIQRQIAKQAERTLESIALSGWKNTLGGNPEKSKEAKIQVLSSISSGLTTRNKLWAK